MTVRAGGLVDVADFVETDYIPCDPTAGTSFTGGFEVEARRIGDVVYIDGRMTRTSSTTTQAWFTLPEEIPPPRRATDITQHNTTATRAAIGTDGVCSTFSTPAGASSFHINAWYTVAADA